MQNSATGIRVSICLFGYVDVNFEQQMTVCFDLFFWLHQR